MGTFFLAILFFNHIFDALIQLTATLLDWGSLYDPALVYYLMYDFGVALFLLVPPATLSSQWKKLYDAACFRKAVHSQNHTSSVSIEPLIHYLALFKPSWSIFGVDITLDFVSKLASLVTFSLVTILQYSSKLAGAS